MNNLQQLEQIIREANPGLMESKKGFSTYAEAQIGYIYPNIHLEHMLKAVKRGNIMVSNKGYFYEVPFLGVVPEVRVHYVVNYDLTKQLSEQSEETIKGLLELLK